jgi:hypothetical protein
MVGRGFETIIPSPESFLCESAKIGAVSAAPVRAVSGNIR